jgi:hypothetical protein
VALRFAFIAHCSRCGNFELQRISREYVTGGFAWLFRLMRVRALRCDPCRNRFFSIRPCRQIRPAPDDLAKKGEQAASETSAQRPQTVA